MPNPPTNSIFAYYIKDNLGLIYTSVFAFKPLYYKMLYLLGAVLINIVGDNRDNGVVIGQCLKVKG